MPSLDAFVLIVTPIPNWLFNGHSFSSMISKMQSFIFLFTLLFSFLSLTLSHPHAPGLRPHVISKNNDGNSICRNYFSYVNLCLSIQNIFWLLGLHALLKKMLIEVPVFLTTRSRFGEMMMFLFVLRRLHTHPYFHVRVRLLMTTHVRKQNPVAMVGLSKALR